MIVSLLGHLVKVTRDVQILSHPDLSRLNHFRWRQMGFFSKYDFFFKIICFNLSELPSSI